jgi:hypothetical protein
MRALLEWVRGLLSASGRPGASAPPPHLTGELEAPGVSTTCRACDGSGLCRVCRGAGTIDRLVAVAGADAGLVQEPVQQLQTVKCRACPKSSGTCKAYQGRGKIVTAG